jgi:hypothetical protein
MSVKNVVTKKIADVSPKNAPNAAARRLSRRRSPKWEAFASKNVMNTGLKMVSEIKSDFT